MRVVRYTFDVCIRSSYEGDVYTMAHRLEEGIMKVNNVCGCEVSKSTHASLYNCVDVDDVIETQNADRRIIAVRGGAA